MTTPGAAFSLVELVVVMAIIAILASLLLPGVSLVSDMAKSVRCLNSLRQIGLAMQGYISDWRGQMVATQIYNTPSHIIWADSLAEYTDDGSQAAGGKILWQCPKSGTLVSASAATSTTAIGYGKFDRLYSPNTLWTSDRRASSGDDLSFRFLRSRITRASLRVAVGDADSYMLLVKHYPTVTWSDQPPWFMPYSTGVIPSDLRQGGDPTRHRGRANYLFVDGRVQSLGEEDACWGLVRPGEGP